MFINVNKKISNKWRKKSEIYKYFALGFWIETSKSRFFSHKEEIKECPFSFSEESALEVYLYETYGIGNIEISIFSNTLNGYAIGKKWTDWHVTNWREDIRKGLLFKDELYQDSTIPKWWLDNIFKNI